MFATVTLLGKKRGSIRTRSLAVSVWLSRIVLGGTFIYSGLAKLYQPYDFLEAVYDYELVGPKVGFVLAEWLPWLELIIGLSLMTGLLLRGGLLLGFVLLCVFTGAQAHALFEDLKIPCGCGLFQTDLVSSETLLRTLILAVVVGYALIIEGTFSRPLTLHEPRVSPR